MLIAVSPFSFFILSSFLVMHHIFYLLDRRETSQYLVARRGRGFLVDNNEFHFFREELAREADVDRGLLLVARKHPDLDSSLFE